MIDPTMTAERHARALVREHGSVKARQLVQDKVADNAHMVRSMQDRVFWIAVLEALR